MLKNILNNQKINKIRKSHSGFNHLIQRIDSLTKSKSSHQEMFEKINMYLDLIERDQQIDIAKEHKHIEATHAQNQKNKEIEHKKKQKQQSKNKVAQFFYDNLAEYKLACTSPTELFNIFQKNKFKSGIYEQTSKMNWYENKLINMLETSGNDFIINFTYNQGQKFEWKFGLPSEYLHTNASNSNIFSELYTISLTFHKGLYIKEETPLMLCARSGMNKVIEHIIKKGCDISVKNTLGQTAFDLYSPNTVSTEEENAYIRSLLDGSYNNGYYISLYEKNKLSIALNDPKIEKKETVKHKI